MGSACVVLYDACVLVPSPMRDLLLRLANKGIFRARWTERILDECFAAVQRIRPDLDPGRLARTRALMNSAVPDCLVVGYEPLIESLTLPDPNDRHVLAAAVRAGAQTIVTSNLKDFPSECLASFDVVAQHPDDFVVEQLELDHQAVISALHEQVAALQRPPRTSPDVLDSIQRNGLVRAAALLREYLGIHTTISGG